MLIYGIILCGVVFQRVDSACFSSRVICNSNHSYTFCVDLGYKTVNLESVNMKCPDGLFCSANHYYPCVAESELPPIGGLPEPVTTTTKIIQVTGKTIPSTTNSPITNTILVPSTESHTTIRPTLTTISIINSTTAVPSIITTSILVPSIINPLTSVPSVESPTTITPTLTSITLINSTTAVPSIITTSTLVPSTINPLTSVPSIESPATIIPTLTTITLINSTTTVPPIITTSNLVPSTANPSTANPSTANPSTLLPPTESHTTITPTLTSITIINSTTAVPPIITTSTVVPPTLIPSTQSISTSVGDNKTVPVITASPPIVTTQVPTLPPCPNPPAGVQPECKTSGSTSPGPVCTKFYECVPLWFRLVPEERICARGRAYSASQRKCVIPPQNCICAN